MSTLISQFLVAVDGSFCISVLTIAQSHICLLPLLWLLEWLNHRIDFSQKSTKYLSTQSFVQKKKKIQGHEKPLKQLPQISDRGFCNRRLRSHSIFMTVLVSSSSSKTFLTGLIRVESVVIVLRASAQQNGAHPTSQIGFNWLLQSVSVDVTNLTQFTYIQMKKGSLTVRTYLRLIKPNLVKHVTVLLSFIRKIELKIESHTEMDVGRLLITE